MYLYTPDITSVHIVAEVVVKSINAEMVHSRLRKMGLVCCGEVYKRFIDGA